MPAFSRLVFALALGSAIAAGVVGLAYRLTCPPPTHCIDLPAGQTALDGTECLWVSRVDRDTVVAQGVVRIRTDATGAVEERRVALRVDPATLAASTVPSPYPYLIVAMWLTAGAYVVLGRLEEGRPLLPLRRGSRAG